MLEFAPGYVYGRVVDRRVTERKEYLVVVVASDALLAKDMKDIGSPWTWRLRSKLCDIRQTVSYHLFAQNC